MWDEFHYWLAFKLNHLKDHEKIDNVQNFQDFSFSFSQSLRSELFDNSNPKIAECVSKLFEFTMYALKELEKVASLKLTESTMTEENAEEAKKENSILDEKKLKHINSPSQMVLFYSGQVISNSILGILNDDLKKNFNEYVLNTFDQFEAKDISFLLAPIEYQTQDV